VNTNILMPLLEPPVLTDVMKVVTSDNNSPLHLGRNNKSFENSSANGHVSSEGALFINVVSFDGTVRSLNSKSNSADETHRLLALVADGALAGNKHSILLLVRVFVLIALLVFLWETGHSAITTKSLVRKSGQKSKVRDQNSIPMMIDDVVTCRISARISKSLIQGGYWRMFLSLPQHN